MTLIIRDATPEDKSGWHTLWNAYLAFYRVNLADDVTEHTWARLMDPASPLKARLATRAGRIVGFAIHQHHPSSWVPGDDCYLEDLFVAETERGKGTGRALIDDLMAHARAKGWHRLYWHTDEGNARARALYDSYSRSDGHIRYRLQL